MVGGTLTEMRSSCLGQAEPGVGETGMERKLGSPKTVTEEKHQTGGELASLLPHPQPWW